MSARLHRPSSSIALLLYAAVASSASAQSIGWWRFEEGPAGRPALLTGSISDLISGNNGTPIGAPPYTANDVSSAGLGLRFDGGAQRVFVPDIPACESLKSLSVEVILSTPGYHASPYGLNQLVFRGDDRGGLDPFFLALRSDGHVAFFMSNTEIVASPEPLPLNTIVSIAATLEDETGAAKLFINGAVVASAGTKLRPDGVLTGPSPGIGFANVQSENFAQYFEGILYEVRLSARALNAEDLLAAPKPVLEPREGGAPPDDAAAPRPPRVVDEPPHPLTLLEFMEAKLLPL